jgi:hypothetical protein
LLLPLPVNSIACHSRCCISLMTVPPTSSTGPGRAGIEPSFMEWEKECICK